ncbi:MAG: DUF2088 domain-containing protein [Spirochaetaceae bacterium]|nr:MAG: DUF2088 domain-containing protein [Spirochaetaceae bacterium]
MSIFNELLDPIPIPRLVRVRRRFDRAAPLDLESDLVRELRGCRAFEAIRPGMKIAIAVGSRGVSNQPLIVRTLVSELKKAGAAPFIVPAMGSHGGATAEGQQATLARLGIDESTVGAPVRATMETVELGTTASGLPVNLDRYAAEADAIVIVNRIKPHVSFRGRYESGLVKMIAIGLGKQRGAEVCHNLGFGTMASNIREMAEFVLSHDRIVFGVALLENVYHDTVQIAAIPADEILEREPDLLERAKALSPPLPFDALDVLVIDEIGKEYSGTGFDTNVVGRYHTPFISGGPDITRIVVLDLTDKSNGNANGIGIVDFTTRRVFEKFKFDQTYPNSLTSTVPQSVKIPMVLESDRHAVQAAIRTCNIVDKKDVRLVRIKNTAETTEFEISESLVAEARANPALELLGESYTLEFEAAGNLF